MEEWDDWGTNDTSRAPKGQAGWKATNNGFSSQNQGTVNGASSGGFGDAPDDGWGSSAPASSGGGYGGGGGGYGKSGGGGGGSGCRKCGEDGHFARECPNAGSGGGGRGSGCHKCGEDGHFARECPNAGSGGGGGGGSGCRKCGEDGHFARECPNAGSGGGGGGGSGCRKCGEDGHFARECPTAGGSGDRPKGCFNCGEEGHNKADCPNPPKPRELDPDRPAPVTYIPEEFDVDKVFEQTGISSGINFDKYERIPVSLTGNEPTKHINQFEEAGLRPILLENVVRAGYKKPTPVQKYSIPVVKNGRDLMACAQTGSGKTAAFLLPIIHQLLEEGISGGAGEIPQQPACVIMSPTRELAIQIYQEAIKFCNRSVIRPAIAYGGAAVRSQLNKIMAGCHILVATPGRLKDFVGKGQVAFGNLRFFVLDEADRMLDMGFLPDINELMEHPSMPAKTQRQTLMFSATFPAEIQAMAAKFLNDYLYLTIGTVGAANTDVTQTFYEVERLQKRELLLEILNKEDLDKGKILIFVETKKNADFLASFLSQKNFPTTSIHGDRLQQEREQALGDFKSGKMPCLVATAVAARGLDIRGVSHVINYDMPKEIDEYIHRIGRTGRVGNTGKATSFFDPSNDGQLAAALLNVLGSAQQDVPDWLPPLANGGGGGGGFGGSRDARGGGGMASGGAVAAVEEDEW